MPTCTKEVEGISWDWISKKRDQKPLKSVGLSRLACVKKKTVNRTWGESAPLWVSPRLPATLPTPYRARVQPSVNMVTSTVGPANRADSDDWLSAGRFALILVALVLASFPQVCLGLETFVVRDFGFFAYPLAHYQRECFWRGELPLWNPYNNCGVPFLAQWNTMPLYPPALIYLIFPLSWSLSIFSLVHVFWAGFGMYLLAQRWAGNRLSAAVAGLIFAFNGLALNLIMWPSHIATYSWMPWVVLTVERAWREGRHRILLAGLVGAMQMLAGGPETILFTWLILFAWWILALGECLRPRTQHLSKTVDSSGLHRPTNPQSARPPGFSRRIFWRFPGVVVLVACLAAAQLLPFMDLAAHSQREQGFADTRWSMPAWGWANFLVPMVFGSTWRQNLFFQYGQYWTSSYYLGIGALLLALLALVCFRERRVWFFASISTVALLLALGDQTAPSRWLRSVVPQLSLITYPVKYVTLVAFAVPLMAAFGLAGLRQIQFPHKSRPIIGIAGVLLALIAAILLWAWRWPMPLDDFAATLRNGLARGAFLVVIAVLILLLKRPARIKALIPLLLLLLLWLDLWTHEPPQNPTVPHWIYDLNLARKELAMNPQPELGQSRAMVSPAAETRFMQLALDDPKNNFLAKRMGYFADCNLLDSVPKVNGFFSLSPRESGELNSILYVSKLAYPPQLADFMSVSQITSPDDPVKWMSRTSFLPIITAGQKPVFVDDTNALVLLLSTNFDGRKVVLLPPEARSLVSVTNQSRATIVPTHFKAEQIGFRVEAAQPALVVVSQTYYHPWRAFVDGKAEKLFRANYAFQALQVPPGSHDVQLRYQDRAFAVGSLISGLAILVCFGSWLAGRKASLSGTDQAVTISSSPPAG